MSISGFEFAQEVAKDFPLQEITCRGRQVWPIIRTKYYFAADQRIASLNKSFSAKAAIPEAQRLLNLRHGFPGRWRRNYDAVLFTSGDIAKETPSGFLDKNAHWLAAKAAGDGPFLTVEFPKTRRHHATNRCVSRERISQDYWSLKALLARPVAPEECTGLDILEAIQQQYGIQLADRKNLGVLFSLVDSIEAALKRWAPKLLVVNCYYSIVHQAAIMAATRLGIPSIETQHGLISPASAAYTYFHPFERNALPDHLAIWGEQSLPIFHDKNYFIDPQNIHVIGNGYIEQMANTPPSVPEWLAQRCAKYKSVVCIASQEILDDEVLQLTSNAARQDLESLYIFLPRRASKIYPEHWFTDNYVNASGFSFYDIVRLADLHATVYSTTALEAPALGVANILLNIGGRSKEHLGNANLGFTKIVETPEQLATLVRTWDLPSKEEIRAGHQQVFALNHEERIQACLDKIFTKTVPAS